MKRCSVFLKKYWVFIPFGLMAIALAIICIVIFDDTYMPKDNIEDIVYCKNCQDYVYDTNQENAFTKLQAGQFKNKDETLYIENCNLYLENLLEQNRRMLGSNVESFAVVNDTVYYLAEAELLRIDAENNNIVLLDNINGNIRTIWVSADNIFFCNENANICRVDKAGNNMAVVSDKNINDFIIRGDKIFYTDVFYDGFDCFTLLYAMNADGTNDQLLIEMSVDEFNVVDNVVYITEDFKNKKYKLDLKRGELQYDMGNRITIY